MEGIKAPRLPKFVIRPLDNDDMKHLVAVTSGKHFCDVRNRAMILIFYDTLIRDEELANIQLKDIDIVQGSIKVFGKGKKERLVPISNKTQRALMEYVLSRKDSLPCLWLTEERRPLTKDGVTIAIRRLMKRAEVKSSKCGPHILRHSGAIAILRNGGDVFALQQLMGHENIATTRKYLSSLGFDDVAKMHRKASPVDNLKL